MENPTGPLLFIVTIGEDIRSKAVLYTVSLAATDDVRVIQN